MVGEVRVARSGGRASQPGLLTDVPRTFGGRARWPKRFGLSDHLQSRRSRWTETRLRLRWATGTPRSCAARFVRSSSARTSNSRRVRYSSSGHVDQQLLLDPLPRLRHGVGCAPSVAAGVERLHLEACAAHRSAARSMAAGSGTRPGARPSGCPSSEHRLRECRRHRLKRIRVTRRSTQLDPGGRGRVVAPRAQRGRVDILGNVSAA